MSRKFSVHPDAIEDIKKLRTRLASLVGARVLTVDQAQREHWESVKRIMAQAVSDDGRDTFAIKCNGCGKVTLDASDVQRYHCKCSPSVERFTSQSRALDLPIGRSAVDHIIAPNGGSVSRILR